MKSIDLTKTLEGHLVLWAKGWYGNGSNSAYKRWNEIVTEWSGMPEDHQMPMKDLLRLLGETADLLGIKQSRIMDTYTYYAAMTAGQLTSYQLTLTDRAAIWDLVLAYTAEIANAPIHTDGMTVLLPKLLPKVKRI